MISEVKAAADLTAALGARLQSAPRLGSNDAAARGALLRTLAAEGLATLPAPAAGATLERWRALATVAGHDLALVKLYEGHTDALAILAEAGATAPAPEMTWGTWAAEATGARVVFEADDAGRCTLSGVKAWCSGARHVDAGVLTVWHADGRGPFLARVALAQRGVSFSDADWQAVGMRASESVSIRLDRVAAQLVGPAQFYLNRPGFWHGGIGVAACWHGGAARLAESLRQQCVSAGAKAGWHRLLALGSVDRVLGANAALLREAATWIDAHPRADAQLWALRTRTATDAACEHVLREVTRALGATPLCRDPSFAQLAADLPVFVRQCHGDRDLEALGAGVAQQETRSWQL